MHIMQRVEQPFRKDDRPQLRPGDQVKIAYRIEEGGKTRIQAYEGTVIAIRGAGLSRSFTVRKVSFGVGVERVFPLHSPHIESIDIVARNRVRRAKLYYLRDVKGRAARLKPREAAVAAKTDAAKAETA